MSGYRNSRGRLVSREAHEITNEISHIQGEKRRLDGEETVRSRRVRPRVEEAGEGPIEKEHSPAWGASKDFSSSDDESISSLSTLSDSEIASTPVYRNRNLRRSVEEAERRPVDEGISPSSSDSDSSDEESLSSASSLSSVQSDSDSESDSVRPDHNRHGQNILGEGRRKSSDEDLATSSDSDISSDTESTVSSLDLILSGPSSAVEIARLLATMSDDDHASSISSSDSDDSDPLPLVHDEIVVQPRREPAFLDDGTNDDSDDESSIWDALFIDELANARYKLRKLLQPTTHVPHNMLKDAILAQIDDSSRLRLPYESPNQLMRECVACVESISFSNSLLLKCGHVYCGPCLTRMFIGVLDPGSAPAQCCSQISLTAARQLLQMTIFSGWSKVSSYQALLEDELKRAAREKLEVNRTYCHRCKAWCENIDGSFVGNTSVCNFEACGGRTCRICGAAEHRNDNCPQDKELEAIHEYAKRNGWMACPKCKRVSDKGPGCNHVECPCGTEYCFLCGEEYSVCKGKSFKHMMAENAQHNKQIELRPISIDVEQAAATQALGIGEAGMTQAQRHRPWDCTHTAGWQTTAEGVRLDRHSSTELCAGCHQEFLWYRECGRCGLSGFCEECAKQQERCDVEGE